MTYDEFFAAVIAPAVEGDRQATRAPAPYCYQTSLATEPWPDMLDIPTGLGKTAAVTGAWLYRRLMADPATPRRLVWCLPMRVLVEQTRSSIYAWLARARPLFEERGLVPPDVHVLMGGEVDGGWFRRPEDPAILVGTQDMLLSRALMRGYAMSRYRWPVDFALLHNDALWVFDEVQLMGAGLSTSAQLEAFRRSPGMPPVTTCRTLWSSATLRREWFDTVDFRRHLPDCRTLALPEEDARDPRVRKRLAASKRLVQSPARMAGARKVDVKAYIDNLCDDILASHPGDSPTLVIVNRVARAQDVYLRLRDRLTRTRGATSLLLVHARYRAAERAKLNERLRGLRSDEDVIVVATQAVEAGVDITSRHLFSELAPWSALVQRFGRCNRGGEYDDAVVHWMDIDAAADAQICLPYDATALGESRETLRTLDAASSDRLPPVVEDRQRDHVLRRKDFLDLFNTEPDLSGFDIDISPYLRDAGGVDVQVFWRDFTDPAAEQRPERGELCPVPLGALREHLRGKRRPFTWDALRASWIAVTDFTDLHPGQILMLQSVAGGYGVDLGFSSLVKERVVPVLPAASVDVKSDAMEGDPDTAGDFVELAAHLLAARDEALVLVDALPDAGGCDAVVEAALWHDVGKAHPAFQTAVLENAADEVDRSRIWAKSPYASRRLDYGIVVDGERQSRRCFRHELASMLAWLEAAGSAAATAGSNGFTVRRAGMAVADRSADARFVDADIDLVAYLIAAHHGKVRVALRALPTETKPDDDRLYARGVWAGDTLPAVAVNGLSLPAMTLRLDIMQLGHGEMGASWSARTAALLARLGPFRLAWLETVVRLADWRASGAGEAKHSNRHDAHATADEIH